MIRSVGGIPCINLAISRDQRQFKGWYGVQHAALRRAPIMVSPTHAIGGETKIMLRPDYNEFTRLARSATLIPVVKSVSADLLTPVSAFLAVAGNEPDAFLLESVERGEQIGRYTFLGAKPYMQVRAKGEEITILQGKKRKVIKGNVFAVVKQQFGKHCPAVVPGVPP